MMSRSFVQAFEEARGDISLPKLAKIMAKRSRPPRHEKGVSGNLYRLVRNSQTPKKDTVIEIADALGELRKLSAAQTQELQDRLWQAANPAEVQTELRRELRPQCEVALGKVGALSQQEIASILDQTDVGTMKLIVAADKKGESIKPVRLPATGPVIRAGRATIHIDGEISQSQKRLLEKTAEMIEAALQL